MGDDTMKEACGVVGVYAREEDVARSVFFGLYALQHRGQENDLSHLSGHIGIGHTRYSTTGSSNINNAQPILCSGSSVEISLAHNGNVINAVDLREELLDWGIQFQSSGDSEIIAHLIANAPAENWTERIAYTMRRLQGAYSLVVMTNRELLGVWDP